MPFRSQEIRAVRRVGYSCWGRSITRSITPELGILADGEVDR